MEIAEIVVLLNCHFSEELKSFKCLNTIYIILQFT